MLSKGFIGPIGDDLPSLIPLIFGLVMFFSTFTLTFNTFDVRNTEFNDDLTVMRISRILQSNSYIFNYENFSELCLQVGTVNMSFVGAISDDAVNWRRVSDISETSIFSNSEGAFYCTNAKGVNNPERISDFIEIKGTDRKVVSRVFPIVLEDEKIVKPMHLYVVVWK